MASAIFINDWPLCIATFGAILTSWLVLLLPSMIYFHLGVTSDYQAIPVLGLIIPNRLFMAIVQVCGVIFFVGNIIKIVLLLSRAEDFRQMYAI